MNELAVTHDTPNRRLICAEAALGLGRIDHTLPFHRSTNVRVPGAEETLPTAMQKPLPTHETLRSRLGAGPAGFGLGWIDQPELAPAFGPTATKAAKTQPTKATRPWARAALLPLGTVGAVTPIDTTRVAITSPRSRPMPIDVPRAAAASYVQCLTQANSISVPGVVP